jgi:hypothetical protein
VRGFRPEREAEIVEEVARQLEDAYAEALRLGSSRQQAREAVESRRKTFCCGPNLPASRLANRRCGHPKRPAHPNGD